MELIRANINYKPQGWMTTCRTCGSEFSFTMKDTHLHIFDKNCYPKYWIQCPYCGAWSWTSVEPSKYDPLNKSFGNK